MSWHALIHLFLFVQTLGFLPQGRKRGERHTFQYQNQIGCSLQQRRRPSKLYCGGDDDDVPLIPKELLFGNAEYRIPSLSPNGKFIAYLGPNHSDGSCCYIYVRQIDQPNESAQVVSPDNRIRNFFWAQDSRTILYYVNVGPPGSETYHLWKTNAADVVENFSLDEANIQDLTPGKGVKARNGVLSTLTHYQDQILIATNERNSTLFDMYRCNINTGERILDTINPGDVLSWGVDQTTFEVRQALVRNQNDSSTTIRIRGQSKEWREIYTYPYGELGSFIAFCGDRESCWITSSLGRDTKALMRINFHTEENVTHLGNESLRVFYHNDCDVEEVHLNRHGNLTMISYHHTRRELHFFDKEFEYHFNVLAKAGPVSSRDEIRIVSKSRDESIWVVSYEPIDAPASYAIYRKKTEDMNPLFCSQPALLQYVDTFSRTECLSIRARDDLFLVSYLTKPRVYSEKHRPPLVLLVHGGPWERDYYGFNPLVQFLANRGYSVLQVNFRGSSGFGKSFLQKGDRQWGLGSMQHDLSDSAQWCIDVGIVDEDKICIFGASYGGYACLAGLCFTPQMYKCGVNIAGVRYFSQTELFLLSFLPSSLSCIFSLSAFKHKISHREYSPSLDSFAEYNDPSYWEC
jgi:dipeptidyl aminopeptidase/acylaminoacyl peptidase